MEIANAKQQALTKPAVHKNTNVIFKIARYSGSRLISLLLAVTIGIFLTILIANMGGYVDRIRLGEIQETVVQNINQNPAYRNLPAEERKQLIEQDIQIQAEAMGLNRPFIIRTVSFMKDAMTLNLGRALKMTSDSGSRQVRLIILERLPSTLLLFGTTSMILFFIQTFLALRLSRNYGNFWDKLVITLAPTSSAPAWFYGIFLIVIFASILRILPFDGMIDAPPPRAPLSYTLSILKHMILPTLALTLNSLFLSIYTWRTFFLIYSSEDYVEIGKAMGLSSQAIEKRYILRPTLPTIITTFALLMIGTWTGAPILETVFNWPGLGRSFYQAIQFYDTPVIVGNTVIFAYLLAITVFILDFVYVLVDPRIRLGHKGAQA
jgi:peptide/nickel transport system permease protein